MSELKWVFSGNLSVVKILLKHRANPYIPDRNGLTAIDQAKELRNQILIDVMVKSANQHGFSKEATLKKIAESAKTGDKEKEKPDVDRSGESNPAQKEEKKA